MILFSLYDIYFHIDVRSGTIVLKVFPESSDASYRYAAMRVKKLPACVSFSVPDKNVTLTELQDYAKIAIKTFDNLCSAAKDPLIVLDASDVLANYSALAWAPKEGRWAIIDDYGTFIDPGDCSVRWIKNKVNHPLKEFKKTVIVPSRQDCAILDLRLIEQDWYLYYELYTK